MWNHQFAINDDAEMENGDGSDGLSDCDLSTDDDFDTIVERKLVDNVKMESAMEVESDDDVAMSGGNEVNHINVTQIKQQQYQQSNASNLGMGLSLKWIDLKNNRGITNDGVDRLNLIFVRKIQPTADFSVSVEGCSYEPNPH